jgi:hypothetical protein
MADPNLSSFIWSVADLLRGDYKRSDFGKVILPFTVLRRLDCVLEATKPAVIAEKVAREKTDLNPEPFLLRKSGQLFFNTSPLDLKKLMGNQDHIGENLRAYLLAFSPAVRDTENVPLSEDVDPYFARKVLPHAPDAWIDHDKTKIGSEIPFNRHFYVFQSPRPLAEIDVELKACIDKGPDPDRRADEMTPGKEWSRPVRPQPRPNKSRPKMPEKVGRRLPPSRPEDFLTTTQPHLQLPDAPEPEPAWRANGPALFQPRATPWDSDAPRFPSPERAAYPISGSFESPLQGWPGLAVVTQGDALGWIEPGRWPSRTRPVRHLDRQSRARYRPAARTPNRPHIRRRHRPDRRARNRPPESCLNP